MDVFVLTIFLMEIRLQCGFVGRGLDQVSDGLGSGSTNQTWFGLQAALVAFANLSKLLWGATPEIAEHRKSLRDLLNVQNDSPLRSPGVRNDFEHFDERIERWAKTTDFKMYFGRNIGPDDWVVSYPEGAPPDRQFGHFNPASMIVTFWNRSVDLKRLSAESARIDRGCSGLSAMPHRELSLLWHQVQAS